MMTAPADRTRGPSYDKLLSAATDAFGRRGLEDVTLDEIARQAGVHRVTLHRTFPGGRDELVLAVVQHRILDVVREVDAAVADAPDADEALVQAILVVCTRLRDDRVLLAMLGRPTTRAALHGPNAGLVQRLAVELWRSIRVRADREGRPTTPADDRDVVDFVFRVGLSLVLEPGRYTTDDTIRWFAETFMAPTLLPRA